MFLLLCFKEDKPVRETQVTIATESEVQPKRLEMIPGVCVKFVSKEPILSLKQLKVSE